MEAVLKEIEESLRFISGQVKKKPSVAVILGTGLGGLVEKISITEAIPYRKIPHFPPSTVEGHEGRLVFGRWAGKSIVVMQGRVHSYEGYPLARVTFPLR